MVWNFARTKDVQSPCAKYQNEGKEIQLFLLSVIPKSAENGAVNNQPE